MTVTTTTTRSVFTGDGLTASFPFTFALQQASDLEVYVNDVLQNLGSAYSVQPTGNSYPCVGGNIVFTLLSTPANQAAGLVVRVMQETQTTALPVEGNISEQTFENVFDKAVMLIQQLQEIINRSITIPITSENVNLQLPAPSANDLIGWDALAQNIVNYAGPQNIIDAAINTIQGSISGNIQWSQPIQVGALKLVVIALNTLHSAPETITFTVPFTTAPAMLNGTSLTVTMPSATNITIPVTTNASGTLILIGM